MRTYQELQTSLVDRFGINSFSWPKTDTAVRLWASMQEYKLGYTTDAAENILTGNNTEKSAYDNYER